VVFPSLKRRLVKDGDSLETRPLDDPKIFIPVFRAGQTGRPALRIFPE
jgi:hypothetical protein